MVASDLRQRSLRPISGLKVVDFKTKPFEKYFEGLSGRISGRP